MTRTFNVSDWRRGGLIWRSERTSLLKAVCYKSFMTCFFWGRLVMSPPNQTFSYLGISFKAMVTESLVQKGLSEAICSSFSTTGRAGQISQARGHWACFWRASIGMVSMGSLVNHSFIHSPKYLLSTYYMPGKTYNVLTLVEIIFQWGRQTISE